MFIDSHCHLDRLHLEPYQGQLDMALHAAREQGVQHFLTVCVDLADVPTLIAIAEANSDISLSVGVHPSDVAPIDEVTVAQLCDLAKHPKVVAIGETGLDYYYHPELAAGQQQSFISHILASNQSGKPLIVHTRDARADTIALLREHKAQQGVLHCFTEDWDTAKAALDLGFYISLSGIVSFANAKDLKEVAKKIPLDRLLIETDSPYLAPVPYRGKKNEPRYLPAVAQAVADIKGLSLAEIAAITTRNFGQLFGVLV
ncbi:MAG: TatD family hydrolase [Moraxellaceae bacterium]|jgi:TatD DNase family protein|nr:TatD family hydrolase [Moraxellaceae bacterium]MBL0229583.1 TatD family hydrolase [Moraxellaceae bacterium]MCC6373320.1 TatD family hydrolase [Moraxellaceae bacterium]HQV79374.1 TatD family hydrolase [Agitococcus sp.]